MDSVFECTNCRAGARVGEDGPDDIEGFGLSFGPYPHAFRLSLCLFANPPPWVVRYRSLPSFLGVVRRTNRTNRSVTRLPRMQGSVWFCGDDK